MSLPKPDIDQEQAPKPLRSTQEMRKSIVYQNKSSRGSGRIEAAKGNVARVKEEGRNPYREEVKLCIERARLITEGYKASEGEPMVIRRAKAMAHFLDNRTIYLLPHERIVGNVASEPCQMITFPEKWSGWLDKAIDTEYSMLLDDDKRSELHQIHDYWRGKSVHGAERDLLPKDILHYWFYPNQGVFLWRHGGHVGSPNYHRIFDTGLKGVIEEAQARLAEISSDPELFLQLIKTFYVSMF